MRRRRDLNAIMAGRYINFRAIDGALPDDIAIVVISLKWHFRGGRDCAVQVLRLRGIEISATANSSPFAELALKHWIVDGKSHDIDADLNVVSRERGNDSARISTSRFFSVR